MDGGIRALDNEGAGERVRMAARALGIDLMVFDSPKHWNAVRSYDSQLDDIVSFRDHCRLPVAEAALKPSLSAYYPLAYEIATDESKTSVSKGPHAFMSSSAEQASAIVKEHGLEFPLTIKPTNGFLSEGVFRAETLSQIEVGVKAIHTERHGNEFVGEKYGESKKPEVDTNLVLCDDELIAIDVWRCVNKKSASIELS
ncbi:hypothetical protein FQN49_005008 [Arthroderma sp. PD_2]|nr:hypothetical protein FQN49_005008 [Arthroderma sp. PD_2]